MNTLINVFSQPIMIVGIILLLFSIICIIIVHIKDSYIFLVLFVISIVIGMFILIANINNYTDLQTKYNQPFVINNERVVSTYDNKDVNIDDELKKKLIHQIRVNKHDKYIINTYFNETNKTYTILYDDYEKQIINIKYLTMSEKEIDMEESQKAFTEVHKVD